MSRGKIKVLHCITSLYADGAQQMLLKLCENISPSRFEFRVLNLRHATEFANRFTELDIPVENLGMRPALPSYRALRQIGRAIDTFQPDLIQGWMYHGNFAASAGRKVASHKPPVVWNIRKAVESTSEYRPLTRLTLKIGAALSGSVAGTIYCGRYIASQHINLGYDAKRQVVIPNGFDTERYRPSPEAYGELRKSLGLAHDTPLVGMTARYHPHKDHRNFLQAAAVVAATMPNVHYVLAGRGLDEQNEEIKNIAQALGILDRLHLLGERSDVTELLPAFDVYCLSSSAEGFPNSLGEAMSCGVPCVTTDAGASPEVIGDAGTVVPVKNSVRLGTAVRELLEAPAEKRRQLGEKARERIIEQFSLRGIAAAYEDYYERTVRGAAAQHVPPFHLFNSADLHNIIRKNRAV